MTRTTDTFVELDDRVAIADRYGPDAILVSIHYNASPSSDPRGVETFFWRSDSYGSGDARAAASRRRNRACPTTASRAACYRLTHNPACAVHPVRVWLPDQLRADESLIGTASFRQKIAQGIADGVLEQHEQGDTNIGSLPPIKTTTYSAPSHRHYHRHTGGRSGRHGGQRPARRAIITPRRPRRGRIATHSSGQ